MPPPDTVTESELVQSIRSCLHPQLQPLFHQSNRCLPILQTTVQRIMQTMGPDCSATSLGQIVSCDHGLTCKVLQVANSAACSPQQTIISIPHAVTWLGFDTVRSLVAAAQLVEQLQHWPERQQLIKTVIARSLLAATYARELAVVMEYPQPSHLFVAALLYSIGDLAIAYQEPKLYQALEHSAKKTRVAEERWAEEIRLIGIPRLTLAQGLAQMWKLPDSLVDLFGLRRELPIGRWQNGHQIYQGVVTGSVRLVEALIDGGSRATVEQTKRALLVGSGLPSGRFADLMIYAMDRGRQLTRSMGLAIDSSAEDALSLLEQDSSAKEPLGKPTTISQAPLPSQPTPLHARPLETLQVFHDSLQQAKDLNNLLITFAKALHHDAGFDRVGVALLNVDDTDLLVGRLVLGPSSLAPYLLALSGSLSREHRFFLDVLKRSDPLLVLEFTNETLATMKPEFLDTWKPTSGIIFPLRIGMRPIGLVYCDRGIAHQAVSRQDYQTCQLFFTAMTLGMNRLAGVL